MSRRWVQQYRRAVLFSAVLLFPFVTAAPTPASEPLADVFERVARSVVVIRATGTEVRAGSDGRAGFKETGSGVLVSADGKVLTAAHVVQGMDEITVAFVDGQQLPREHAELLHVPDAGGVLVKVVVKGSPADAAGILGGSSVAKIDGQDYVLGGDVILAIAGRPVTRPGEYAKVRQWLSEQPPGTYTFKVLRAGHRKDVAISVP